MVETKASDDKLKLFNIIKRLPKPSLEVRIKSKFGIALPDLKKALGERGLNIKKYQGAPFRQGEALDQAEHGVEGWHEHRDLFHGIVPSEGRPIAGGTVTQQVHQVTAPGRTPVIVKSPLDWAELKVSQASMRAAGHGHFFHPRLRTGHREALFHKLASDVFGLGAHVPRTTVFRHPQTGDVWSVQAHVDGKSASKLGAGEAEKVYSQQGPGLLYKLAIMDTVLGNNDRHAGNVFVTPNNDLKLIDNALSFDYTNHLSHPIPHYARHLLTTAAPPSVHSWLQSIKADDIRNIMNQKGVPSAITNIALKRLDSLQKWSRSVMGNPDYSQHFGHGLEIARTHVLAVGRGGEDDFSAIRANTIRRLRRGEPASPAPATHGEKTV